jgi:N-acetyl sugar amidotransferase
VHEEKNQIDWRVRKVELQSIFFDQKNSAKYDCIIPVTGGQDSFFTVHYAIHELGLNPLLVNFNRTFNSKEGLRNLALLRSTFDADFRQFTINPRVARAVIGSTLANLGTINWLWIAGQTSLPVRIAIELKIPFILWGAHQGIEQVGMYSHLENVEMTSRYRQEHDLLGVDESKIFDFNPSFTREDIASLAYPNDRELLSSGVRGIYLGNFVRWDPTAQHLEMKAKYGYGGRPNNRAYSIFDNPDCPVYFGLQDALKQIKFGYSKATDQLSREIRHGRITRYSAIRTEKKILNRKPEGILEFANWMGITLSTVNTLLLNHSNNFGSQMIDGGWNEERVRRSESLKIRSGFKKRKFIDSDFLNIGKGI